jgi:hypothetical protein
MTRDLVASVFVLAYPVGWLLVVAIVVLIAMAIYAIYYFFRKV